MTGNNIIKICCSWDEEANVWCAECDEIGLALESDSYDALLCKIRMAVPELLDLNGFDKNQSLTICTSDRQMVCA